MQKITAFKNTVLRGVLSG